MCVLLSEWTTTKRKIRKVRNSQRIKTENSPNKKEFQNNTVMKRVLNRSQKTTSAIVALMLGAVVTFTAVMSSFGGSNEADVASKMLEEEILERAYADATMEEFEIVEVEEVQKIKIYDDEYNLVETIELGEGDVIEDAKAQSLVRQAEFLTEYNNTSIYRISK